MTTVKAYFRVVEILEVCEVDEAFVQRLERERIVRAVRLDDEPVYSADQVDRIRVAHHLMHELGVNLEGVEVALRMREQVLDLQQRIDDLVEGLLARSR